MLLGILMFIATLVEADEDVIYLKEGRLRGHRLVSRKGQEIFAYHGIPYAQPPIGDLRFKPPQPPQPWDDILDATKDGPMCLQRNFFNPDDGLQGKEDCLYLNVFTPQKPGTMTDEPIDVMFWIHGGGWVSGSGNSEEFGPQYLLDKNVILVTINYRLGALGFLSTGNKESPGNNGLKDMVAALRWVQENIAAFGGNPKSVTIFGESAGGASVHYLLLSPTSQGLFHRAISQSGTILVNWAFSPNGSTVHHTKKLAGLLRCPTEPTSLMLSCLRKKDAVEIASKDRDFMEWDSDPMIPFNVVVESEVEEGDEIFLPAKPEEMIFKSKHTVKVPWMVGLNSGEGAIDVARLFRNDSLIEDINKRFDDVISLIFFIRETAASSDVKKITRKIKKFYFEDHPINRGTALALRDMFTDAFIFYGTDKAVRLHAKEISSQVFYYYFDYRGTHSFSSMFGDFTHDYGVCHQDELLYLFPQDHLFPNSTRSEHDDRMVDILTTLWTDFAHTGNPTPDFSNVDIWKPVSSLEVPEYVHIKSDGLHTEYNLLKKRADFWASLPIHSAGNGSM